MNLLKNIFLYASRNNFLKKHLPDFYFIKKAVNKFMPGENPDDAIAGAVNLNKKNCGVVFTYLGENLNSISEAENVKNHYLFLLSRISEEKLNAEISLKLTQLGFDISFEKSFSLFEEIAAKAKELNNFVWIDMEDSSYTQKTIDFYNDVNKKYSNTGICLQAYLKRTVDDIKNNLNYSASIRLVKGAYKEKPETAFTKKSDVDKNYIRLTEILLHQPDTRSKIVFGTHDLKIINKIKNISRQIHFDNYEFHFLYGIKSKEQIKLAEEGYKVKVLISYGEAWFAWYMRRLAERPANIWFVIKNIISVIFFFFSNLYL